MASYQEGGGHVMVIEEINGDRARVSEANIEGGTDAWRYGHGRELRHTKEIYRGDDGRWYYPHPNGPRVLTIANLPGGGGGK